MAQQLLEEMIQKINAITQSLDGTIAQLQNMNTSISQMSQRFSEEIVSLTENIRLIVEILKQFRVQSAKSINELSNEFNEKIQELWDKKSIESILKDEKKAIDVIRKGEKSVANNLYYAQLLTIIRSIREETNRILLSKK
jgi:methyl-accepting chemotaxis protein